MSDNGTVVLFLLSSLCGCFNDVGITLWLMTLLLSSSGCCRRHVFYFAVDTDVVFVGVD